MEVTKVMGKLDNKKIDCFLLDSCFTFKWSYVVGEDPGDCFIDIYKTIMKIFLGNGLRLNERLDQKIVPCFQEPSENTW